MGSTTAGHKLTRMRRGRVRFLASQRPAHSTETAPRGGETAALTSSIRVSEDSFAVGDSSAAVKEADHVAQLVFNLLRRGNGVSDFLAHQLMIAVAQSENG